MQYDYRGLVINEIASETADPSKLRWFVELYQTESDSVSVKLCSERIPPLFTDKLIRAGDQKSEKSATGHLHSPSLLTFVISSFLDARLRGPMSLLQGPLSPHLQTP